jgi:sec-independent protein translocase protein TatA
MFGMGPWELFLIFVVILLLFGAKRLPEMAKGMGRALTVFKKELKETTDEIKGTMDDAARSNDSAKPPQKKTTDDGEKNG